ncbi:MAG: sterol desaturase family protein [Congregibacter sp.]
MNIEITQLPFNALAQNRDMVLLLATFGGMLLLMMIEQLAPRRSEDTNPGLRWFFNWGIACLNLFVLLYVAVWVSRGLSELPVRPPLADVFAELPTLPALLVVLLLVEALSYWLHRAYHRIPALWYLHSVHHSDEVLDATTSHRHHLGEVLLNSMALMPVMLLLGAPPGYLVAVTLVRLPVILWSHGNITLPDFVERNLRGWLVTPDFHRVHHAKNRQIADHNYGTMLPWFDYLFGTAKVLSREALQTLPIGIDKAASPAPRKHAGAVAKSAYSD